MAPDASTSSVDWSRPIEAVHEDGRVLAAISRYVDEDGDHMVWAGKPTPGDWCNGYHHADGSSVDDDDGWRIRNVQPTTPERDPALWDRMVALLRRVVADTPEHLEGPWMRHARAIVADLPKPVDPDLIEARKLVPSHVPSWGPDDHARCVDGELDANLFVIIALAALKRGRELATLEVSHVG